MLWKGGRKSDNVEDQRGPGMGRGVAGGGIGILVIAVIAMLFGVDPSALLNQLATAEPPSATSTSSSRPGKDELTEFVSVVLADTEDTWQGLFKQMGGTYREPKLVLFSNQVRSACGFAQAATGPFYCPADQKVYIDLIFFRSLKLASRHREILPKLM